MSKTIFPDISALSWQHPADTAAIKTLEKIPALKDVIKFFLGFTSDRSLRLLFLANGVKVGPTQFPKVHKLTQKACEILDIKEIPEVYVIYDPRMNAGTLGVKKPLIVLNSSLVHQLEEEELLGVIAHELGHILSGHVLYKTLLYFLLNVSFSMIKIPMAELVLIPIIIALKEWDRKSELSADRAELLVTQNLEVCLRTLMKLAGGPQAGEMDLNEFLNQAAQYEQTGDALDSFYKFLNLMGKSHPFPVIRLPELKTWHDGGEYGKILKGDYIKRNADNEEDLGKIWEKANEQYKADMAKSEDPLTKTMHQANQVLDQIGKEGEKIIKNLFSGFKDNS